jgi:hypothetical protein
MLPICGSLFKSNWGVIIIQSTQLDLICWSKAFATDWCYGYPPYRWQSILFIPLEQNALEKNMAWLTCFNGVKICKCYAIPYPKII